LNETAWETARKEKLCPEDFVSAGRLKEIYEFQRGTNGAIYQNGPGLFQNPFRSMLFEFQ
jgi:hypothetical protein